MFRSYTCGSCKPNPNPPFEPITCAASATPSERFFACCLLWGARRITSIRRRAFVQAFCDGRCHLRTVAGRRNRRSGACRVGGSTVIATASEQSLNKSFRRGAICFALQHGIIRSCLKKHRSLISASPRITSQTHTERCCKFGD